MTAKERIQGKQLFLPGIADTASMVREAVDYLRQYEPEGGYFVGFSGGKDSIVTLALCEMAGVRHQAFYNCTGICPPEVEDFISSEYPGVKWLHPKTNYFSLVERWGPPRRVRGKWCTQYLKNAPSRSAEMQKYRVVGIRAKESNSRASYPRTDDHHSGHALFKPIFHWPEYHVWDFIHSHGLRYPFLYEKGFDRLGCVVCPYLLSPSRPMTQRREESMRRWPNIWDRNKVAYRKWWTARQGTNPDRAFSSFEACYSAYLKGFK